MDNLEGIEKILESDNLPRLTQEETENLNQSQVLRLKLPRNQSPGSDGAQANYIKHLENSF